MNRFDDMQGKKVTVDFSNDNVINYRSWGKLIAEIDFQCCEMLGCPGLVYIKFVPKGKRAMRCGAVHQDRLTLIEGV